MSQQQSVSEPTWPVSPWTTRASTNELPVREYSRFAPTVTAASEPRMIRTVADLQASYGFEPAAPVECGECVWHPGTCATHDASLDEHELEVTEFVRTVYCTKHCGFSQFPDWLHTPKCEADEQAAYEAKYAECSLCASSDGDMPIEHDC